MACRVNRNGENRIVSVETEEGLQSELYDKIVSNAFGGTPEMALTAYGNIYSDSIKKKYNNVSSEKYIYDSGEPRLYYKGFDGVPTEVLGDVVRNTDGFVEAGFLDPKTDKLITTHSFNMDKTPFSKTVKSLIREGSMSSEKVIGGDGVLRYKGAGVIESSIRGTAWEAKNAIETEMGRYVSMQQDGSFTVYAPKVYTEVKRPNGTTEHLTLHQAEKELRENPDNISNKVDVILDTIDIFNSTPSLSKEQAVGKISSKKVLLSRLTNFLESMGFSIDTVENYKKNYAERIGDSADIEALVDLSKRVVALSKEGLTRDQIIENLTEEVAHLAVEGYSNRSEIEGALNEVENTEEYKQWAEKYRKRYSKSYSGEELERKVRKEILGKLVAKQISNPESEDNRSVFKKVWDAFIEKIRQYFTKYHQGVLDRITKDIANSVTNNNIRLYNKKGFEDNGVYFSLTAKQRQSKKQTIKDIVAEHSELYAKLSDVMGERGVTFTASSREQIESFMKKTEDIDTYSAIKDIALTTKDNAESLILDIEKAKKGNVAMKMSSLEAFRNMKEVFDDHYTDYISFLDKLGSNSDIPLESITSLKRTLQDVSSQLNTASGIVNKKVIEEGYDEILEAFADFFNLEGEKRKEFFERANNIQKDAGWLQKVFGLAPESSNFNIGLLGALAHNINNNVQARATQFLTKKYREYMKKGYNKHEVRQIQRDDKGKLTHFFKSHVEHWRWERDWTNFHVEQLTKLTDKTEKEIKEEIRKSGKSPTKFDGSYLLASLENGEQKTVEYQTARDNKAEEINESYLTDTQKKEIDVKFKRANVSDETRAILRNTRRNIRKAVESSKGFDRETGRLDVAKMTEAEKNKYYNLLKTQQILRTPIDSQGNYYRGLTQKRWDEMTPDEKNKLPEGIREMDGFESFMNGYSGMITILDGTEDYDGLSEEAKYSFDMQNMRIEGMVGNSGNTNTKTMNDFIAEVKRLEDEGNFEDAFAFATMNGALGYSDLYYESLDYDGGYLSAVQDKIDKEGLHNLQPIVDRIKELKKQRSAILNPYRNREDSDEIGGDKLTAVIRDKIKNIQTEIQDLQSNLPQVEGDKGDKVKLETKTSVNKAFERGRIERGLSEKDFAKEHMTERDRIRVGKFEEYLIDRLLRGSKKEKESYEKVFNRLLDNKSERELLGYLRGGVSDNYNNIKYFIDEITTEYAKEKVLPYFKKTGLEGKEEFIQELKSGSKKVSELLDGNLAGDPIAKYFRVTPDFTWMDVQNNAKEKNKYYVKAMGGIQPKYEKYKTDLQQEFGFSNEDFIRYINGYLDDLKATKNSEVWGGLKIVLAIKKETDGIYGNRNNLFERVQMSSSGYEKLRDVKNIKSNAKDFISDALKDRADEKIYGEYTTAAMAKYGIKVPPKFYRTRLESPDVLTKNSLSAVIRDNVEALRYQERLKAMPIAELTLERVKGMDYVRSHIRKRTANGNTITGEVSNTYKMGRELVDRNIYGVKQNMSMEFSIGGHIIDGTRVVQSLQHLSSTLNLRLSPIIEATNLLVNTYNINVEKIAGNYLSKDSYNRSRMVANTDMAKSVSDYGRLDARSRYVNMLHFLNLRTIEEQTEESRFSRGERKLKHFNSALTEISDHPARATLGYAVLHDFRVVKNKNGKASFLSYRQFESRKHSENPSLSKKEIRAEWKNNKDYFFNYLKPSKNGIVATQEFYDLFSSKEEADKVFANTRSLATNIARQMMQRVNGVIDVDSRSFAQANAVMNTGLQHRGFLSINAAKMFKGRGVNWMTGHVDEGRYRTAMRLMGDFVFDLKKWKRILDMKNNKKVWNELSYDEQRNLRRVAIEVAAYTTIMLILFGLRSSRNDDDNSWFRKFSELIAIRALTQVRGNLPQGFAGETLDAIESPVVMKRTYDEMFELMSDYTSNDWDRWDGKKFKRILIPWQKGAWQTSHPNETLNGWLQHQEHTLPDYLLNQDQR